MERNISKTFNLSYNTETELRIDARNILPKLLINKLRKHHTKDKYTYRDIQLYYERNFSATYSKIKPLLRFNPSRTNC